MRVPSGDQTPVTPPKAATVASVVVSEEARMIVRPTARVIALDPNGRLLLFECEVPLAPDHADPVGGAGSRVFWVTPGGGVEAGETFEDAARREFQEETGIEAPAVGQRVSEDEAIGRHPDYGEQDILFKEAHFLVRLSAAQVACLSPGAVARAGYRAYRWWSLDELERTDEEIWPELPVILRRVLAGW